MRAGYEGDVFVWDGETLVHSGPANAYVETLEDAFTVMEDAGIEKAEVYIWNDRDQMYEFSEWLEVRR